MGELAMERSGPERFLTTYILLETALEAIRDQIPPGMLGDLIARLTTLRAMSRGVALRLQQGEDQGTEAGIVKQLGTDFEKHLFAAVRNIIATSQESERTAELR